MDSFQNFYRTIKMFDDEFNDLLDHKHKLKKFYGCTFTDEEFALMYYVNALINEKTPVHEIMKKLPTKFKKNELVKKTLQARLRPKKRTPLVEWSAVHFALEHVEKHNRRVYDYKYFEEYHPCRLKVY